MNTWIALAPIIPSFALSIYIGYKIIPSEHDIIVKLACGTLCVLSTTLVATVCVSTALENGY